MPVPVTFVPAVFLAVFVALPFVSLDGSSEQPVRGEPKPVDFDRDVKPIFAKHCVSCHGPDKQKNGLRLDRKADAATVLVAGKSATACWFNSSPGRTRTGRCPRRGG